MILVQAPIRYKDPASNESSVQYYIYVDVFTDVRYTVYCKISARDKSVQASGGLKNRHLIERVQIVRLRSTLPCKWMLQGIHWTDWLNPQALTGKASTGPNNGDVAASALAEHTLDTGHPLDLTKAKVIDHHLHTMTQCLLESWHIQRTQGTLNRKRGTPPEVYKELLD